MKIQVFEQRLLIQRGTGRCAGLGALGHGHLGARQVETQGAHRKSVHGQEDTAVGQIKRHRKITLHQRCGLRRAMRRYQGLPAAGHIG